MQNSLVDSLLVDNYQRRFEYIRLSITELCNFRCQYCLPNGYQSHHSHQFLTYNEINQLIKTFGELGVKKIRLTGGEPTLRRDLTQIIELIAKYPMIKDIALTTNGYRLNERIVEWHNAGLTSLNVSIDSFVPQLFQLITGENKLHSILDGVEKSLANGMTKVKINTVLMKGLNDNLSTHLQWIKHRPVELRYIELMETNSSASHFSRYYVSGASIEQQLIQQGWQLQLKQFLAGPAKVYCHDDYQGKIGLIMPYSKDFCQSCNRLRISATGKLHYCLFGAAAIDLRDLLQDHAQSALLKQRILTTLKIKPPTHYLHQHNAGMIQTLSIIGG